MEVKPINVLRILLKTEQQVGEHSGKTWDEKSKSVHQKKDEFVVWDFHYATWFFAFVIVGLYIQVGELYLHVEVSFTMDVLYLHVELSFTTVVVYLHVEISCKVGVLYLHVELSCNMGVL